MPNPISSYNIYLIIKNIVLSSVIVDKKFEYVLVTVDKDGFHPDYLD